MIAALLTGLAAALVVAGDPARRLRVLDAGAAVRGTGRLVTVVVIALAAAGCLVLLGPRWSGWLAICGVVAGTVFLVVARGRRRRAARAASADTARAARLLASLLRSGLIPGRALALTAEDFPVLRPAATSAALGGDPAGELAAAARVPGCEGLGTLGAAWQVAGGTGAPVAQVLGDIAQRLREERSLQGTVEQELSTARATGQIMAALPFAAVLLGTAAGADPLGFLLASPLGEALILVGVVLTATGVLWIDRLATPGGRRW